MVKNDYFLNGQVRNRDQVNKNYFSDKFEHAKCSTDKVIALTLRCLLINITVLS